MKRLVLAIAAAALPFCASASPELAGDWGVKASGLYQDTVSLIADVETSGETAIPRDYEVAIERFAMTASNLGHWVDGDGGPSDLGCIFRGMAEEGEVQLMALYEADSPRETRSSLIRLAAMFSDAEIIAAAAMHASDHDAPAAPTGIAVSCPVNTAAAHAALD